MSKFKSNVAEQRAGAVTSHVRGLSARRVGVCGATCTGRHFPFHRQFVILSDTWDLRDCLYLNLGKCMNETRAGTSMMNGETTGIIFIVSVTRNGVFISYMFEVHRL